MDVLPGIGGRPEATSELGMATGNPPVERGRAFRAWAGLFLGLRRVVEGLEEA